MALFRFCAVCNDVELQNKAALVGFFGMLPFVEINVPEPTLPLDKLVFLMMSGSPVPPGKYRVTLSIKGPSGQDLFRLPAVMDVEAPVLAPLNVALTCQPLHLSGVGTYKLKVTVNGKEDFQGEFKIGKTPSPSA